MKELTGSWKVMNMAKVTVQIGEKIYQMTRKEANGLLSLAKEQVALGIYALEKKNIIQLRCDRLSVTQTKQMRRTYMNMGFRVYANGL